MIKITKVSGNIFHDGRSIDENTAERLLISRGELEKNRLRRETDKGTDVGIVLEPGSRLHHGDVLESEDKLILVRQTPEKVITVNFKNGEGAELMVLAGHIIGNRHRPISINDDTVSFPIQSESEMEVFGKLFSGIIDKIELKIEEKIFHPHTGADVHGH